MSTWEERMAERAARGPIVLDRETARRVAEERAKRAAADAEWERMQAEDLRTWLGTCDVCGEPMLWKHSGGGIDTAISENDVPYTYIRHIDGPLQPDCGSYLSPVYQVPE